MHNVRIERLWGDVTNQVGASWAEEFMNLELHRGLDINNQHHIWLLHHLFLQPLNDQLNTFITTWNHHKIQIKEGPNRSPIDMFGFDMLVHGVRGDQLPEDLTNEELEVFGVDWDALREDRTLNRVRATAEAERGSGWSSWVGREGPPPELNEVPVEPPRQPITFEQLQLFDNQLHVALGSAGLTGRLDNISATWSRAAALAQDLFPGIF